ncbi:MAG: hypothetical protein P8Y14_16080 [Anaerolineales bacterium]
MHASRGRLYVTMNDQEGARKEYSAAREIIEELAATVQDEALKEDFLRGAYSTLEPR